MPRAEGLLALDMPVPSPHRGPSTWAEAGRCQREPSKAIRGTLGVGVEMAIWRPGAQASPLEWKNVGLL